MRDAGGGACKKQARIDYSRKVWRWEHWAVAAAAALCSALHGDVAILVVIKAPQAAQHCVFLPACAIRGKPVPSRGTAMLGLEH